MQNIWTDPVWSKVIAAGIIAIAGFLLRIFWNKLPFSKKESSSSEIAQTNTSIETSRALALIDVNPSIFESQFDDPAAYQKQLQQFSDQELITVNENNIPVLTKKGQKLVKKHRKLEEKLRD